MIEVQTRESDEDICDAGIEWVSYSSIAECEVSVYMSNSTIGFLMCVGLGLIITQVTKALNKNENDEQVRLYNNAFRIFLLIAVLALISIPVAVDTFNEWLSMH